MVGIYDKGMSDSAFIQNIKKYAKQDIKTYSELQNLQKCEIAIVHIYGEEWDSLIKNSLPGYVRVRVTIGGDFSDKPQPTVESGVYIFHLAIHAGDLKTEWREILSGLSDKAIVASLVRGENPNGLRRFFVHEIQGYLAAIAVLCEGYLAVHAEHPNCHADIRPALNLMKWSEFRISEREQALIRQNLTEKINRVQQPEWWLKVFEQKSFYNDVKKEWETTAETEMPEALRKLLKTIFNGKAIMTPKIVADAYYVLARTKTGTGLSEWQIRRNKFNHDWLKNKFLNSFDDFIVQLKKSKPVVTRVSEFLVTDFPAWKTHQQDAQWIVEFFEDGMSPQRLLASSPLNRCDDETHAWLGNLVHGLWLTRYPVKRKVQESRDALAAVNKMYEQITRELEQSCPIELTKLIALLPQFSELQETYQTLSKTLSNLPRYESHGR